VVFSLFNRKDRLDPRRSREALLARTADSRPGPSTDTLAAQREAARRTEEKINQIESEMIAAAVVARAAAEAGAAEPAAAGRVPAAAPPASESPAVPPTVALGDAAGAMAIDVNASSLPGVLEEAAILYSNGQPQPAAQALRQALGDASLAGYQPLAWLMLLDLYQALGERAAFEALALEYAARFESSPPGWSDQLSGQPLAGRAGAQAAGAPQGGPAAGATVFPARIDASVSAQVDAILRAAATRAEVRADFSAAAAVDAAGAAVLLRLFRHFTKPAACTLVVHGAERLHAAASGIIETGRRDASEAGWMLALQALRVLGRQQAFEDLSIDYCVTYEVSPPSWEPAGERIRLAGEAPAHGAAPEPARSHDAGAFVLGGDLLGRMQAELQALRAYAADRGDIVVDCRTLRRMEFVAAGDLLNEVATLRGNGKQVLFVEPNYLVYALMLVMGIHELAEIRRRKI